MTEYAPGYWQGEASLETLDGLISVRLEADATDGTPTVYITDEREEPGYPLRIVLNGDAV